MDLEDIIRFTAALVFVLGLIGLLALLGRRFGLGNRVTSRGGQRRRLGIVEVMALDSRRRLVLVRRDDREHLILLGAGNAADLVIEQDIAAPRTAPATAHAPPPSPPERPTPADPSIPDPAPRPARIKASRREPTL